MNAIVPPGQRYGYDLIVTVGLSRYIHGQQREEIRQTLLAEHGIKLSAASVPTLCDRFLSYFEALHIHRAPELRVALGEYPLHIDATCEKGKGGLFVCMSGWRGWVPAAARVPSENSDYLRPAIDRTVELFGLPLAVVRDMGSGGAQAVEVLRKQGEVDLICHFHFLAALGGRLFDSGHGLLQKVLKSLELRTALRTLLKELERYESKLQTRISPEDRGRKRPGSAEAIIAQALDRHRARLFGHPARRDIDERVIAVVKRTNNILEQFFGHQKRGLRRRLGRAHLGRDLEQQPAQVALVANLNHSDYLRVLCGSNLDCPIGLPHWLRI